jgi:hypothetical protein
VPAFVELIVMEGKDHSKLIVKDSKDGKYVKRIIDAEDITQVEK